MTPLFSRILIPVDGSDESTAAITLGARFAHDVGATELCFCYVVNTDAEYREAAALDAGSNALELITEMERAGAGYVAQAKALAAAAEVPITTAMLQGNPPEAIATLARERKFDLIITGTHGRDGIERLLFGSTAEKIMRHTKVPVLMVKR